MESFESYQQGAKLYGDDFSMEEIRSWYDDEKEGYAQLGSGEASSYCYRYHAWNTTHGFRHLPCQIFENVLGFGSAYGEELLPLIQRIKSITIVDSSSTFRRENIHGVPATYILPEPAGVLHIKDDSFDLITCLGVLHHIPNVSFVFGELVRVLKSGGYMVLREPMISLGNWTCPRPGLTKRERGIPLHIMKELMLSKALSIVSHSVCGFPLVPRLFAPLRDDTYNSKVATRLDAMLSEMFLWNANYHPRNLFDRLRPTSAFFVVQKI